VADLSNAEEVSHRVRVRENSHLARRPLSDLELPVQTGMRVVAIRRGRDWITDVDGDELCTPGDTLFLRGSPAGIDRLRSSLPPLDGSRRRRPRTAPSPISTAPSTSSSR
jgi:uncharacterized protein with PhoU and TrkA domain